MSRKIAREEFFKLIFEAEMNGVQPNQIVDEFIERNESQLNSNGKKFIKSFAEGISEKSQEIDEKLDAVIENWSLERLPKVEKSLLRFATYELMYENTGHEIVLNEVIELAKVYGEEKSHEFINGVLAKIITK